MRNLNITEIQAVSGGDFWSFENADGTIDATKFADVLNRYRASSMPPLPVDAIQQIALLPGMYLTVLGIAAVEGYIITMSEFVESLTNQIKDALGQLQNRTRPRIEN